eukprot:1135627-Amphidinium_carterae.1
MALPQEEPKLQEAADELKEKRDKKLGAIGCLCLHQLHHLLPIATAPKPENCTKCTKKNKFGCGWDVFGVGSLNKAGIQKRIALEQLSLSTSEGHMAQPNVRKSTVAQHRGFGRNWHEKPRTWTHRGKSVKSAIGKGTM